MNEAKEAGARSSAKSKTKLDLLEQYGCGPIQFSGTNDGLFERHLLFDDVIAPANAGPHERFRAVARSVRDILSQRWVRTEATYESENPKRVYYLSMEFLIGRSLANNITNLLLDTIAKRAAEQRNLNWLGLLEEEPDAGLGNGGLGRLAACFLDSMATMQLPAMGYGLRYEYGIFKQSIKDGWQFEEPDNWLRDDDPWEVARPNEKVEIKLNCSFAVHEGGLRAVVDRPSTVVGLPFDRPVVGLRWQNHQYPEIMGCSCAKLFRFPGIQQRRFCRCTGGDTSGRIFDAGPLSRRFHEHGAGAALCAGIFSGRLLIGRSCAAVSPQ
jgi:glycogen phosphorylase